MSKTSTRGLDTVSYFEAWLAPDQAVVFDEMAIRTYYPFTPMERWSGPIWGSVCKTFQTLSCLWLCDWSEPLMSEESFMGMKGFKFNYLYVCIIQRIKCVLSCSHSPLYFVAEGLWAVHNLRLDCILQRKGQQGQRRYSLRGASSRTHPHRHTPTQTHTHTDTHTHTETIYRTEGFCKYPFNRPNENTSRTQPQAVP